jgi:ATP-dependent RNA helicase DHX29
LCRYAAAANNGQGNGRDAARRYAAKSGLCGETLKQIAEMRGQYAALLGDIGFIKGPKGRRADSSPFGWVDDATAAWNADARRAPVVKAVLTAGLYANVAAMETASTSDGDRGRATWRDVKGEVGIHPSSINSKLGSGGAGSATVPTFPFLMFHEKVRTSRVFVRDSTVVAPAALLLFGGAIDVHHASGRVSLDGWLWLRASAQTAVLYKWLRGALDAALDARIRGAHHHKGRGGGGGGGGGAGGEDLLKTIRSLLTEQAAPK